MLHFRLIVPAEQTDLVIDGLAQRPGVAHIVRAEGATTRPRGVVVTCDVAREAANEVVEWLQGHDVHRHGAISVQVVDVTVSDAAEAAEAEAPGEGGNALVWEELEARVRDESVLTVSFLVFMSIAAILAAIGIILDSAILVIGAMVVGPDYGPLAALCVAIVRRRAGDAAAAGRTVAVGLGVAAVAALIAVLVLRATSAAPDDYDIGERVLTSFIARPDALAVVVAVLAGIVGMLSLTEARSGALVGVLVSVTTIPAVGNIGLATAYGAWREVGGAAIQLGVNVSGLVLAGAVTLAVQAKVTGSPLPERSEPDDRTLRDRHRRLPR